MINIWHKWNRKRAAICINSFKWEHMSVIADLCYWSSLTSAEKSNRYHFFFKSIVSSDNSFSKGAANNSKYSDTLHEHLTENTQWRVKLEKYYLDQSCFTNPKLNSGLKASPIL